MPALKMYDLFISHVWKYNSDYHNLEKLLRNASLFSWRNYSVPEHDPVIDPSSVVGKKILTGMLDNQIRPVNCFLLLGGMYATYSEWIEKEIAIAKKYGKPIIGIYPFGQQNMPRIIREASAEIVGWRTSSIVDAIRRNSI